MDCKRDIWGGRKLEDKVTFRKNNKYFNSIAYNLSGNIIIAGGNSPYICLYDLNFQLMVKRFKITSNRSLDGMLQYLNSKSMKNDENDYYDYDSNDSDLEDINNKEYSLKQKKSNKIKVPIKITKVLFNMNNRGFYVACSEGIFCFTLDTLESSSILMSQELSLDSNISISSIYEAYTKNEFSIAITYCIHLKKYDILDKILVNIDVNLINLIVTKLPFNCIVLLAEFLSSKLENDCKIELYLIWVNHILKIHYRKLVTLGDKKSFIYLNKVIHKHYTGIKSMIEENTNTIDFLLSQSKIK